MAKLNAKVEFGEAALAKLKSEGNVSVDNPTVEGTLLQLRDFFRQAALPQAFSDALDNAERAVVHHIENRGFLGSMIDAVAIAGGGIVGYPVRSLMEDSKKVDGYPDAVVTVIQPGF